MKETPEKSLAPSTMWGYSKKTAVYEPGSRLSLDTQTLNLQVPWSRIMRKKCLLFISHSVHGSLLQQAEQTKTLPKSKISLLCLKSSHFSRYPHDLYLLTTCPDEVIGKKVLAFQSCPRVNRILSDVLAD